MATSFVMDNQPCPKIFLSNICDPAHDPRLLPVLPWSNDKKSLLTDLQMIAGWPLLTGERTCNTASENGTHTLHGFTCLPCHPQQLGMCVFAHSAKIFGAVFDFSNFRGAPLERQSAVGWRHVRDSQSARPRRWSVRLHDGLDSCSRGANLSRSKSLTHREVRPTPLPRQDDLLITFFSERKGEL